MDDFPSRRQYGCMGRLRSSQRDTADHRGHSGSSLSWHMICCSAGPSRPVEFTQPDLLNERLLGWCQPKGSVLSKCLTQLHTALYYNRLLPVLRVCVEGTKREADVASQKCKNSTTTSVASLNPTFWKQLWSFQNDKLVTCC